MRAGPFSTKREAVEPVCAARAQGRVSRHSLPLRGKLQWDGSLCRRRHRYGIKHRAHRHSPARRRRTPTQHPLPQAKGAQQVILVDSKRVD